jgi:EAL domain-containing protein (putative c-di-GMP-specific phosphodiesterase class I)
LMLEITESSLSSDEDRMTSAINALMDLDIQILIDDFGTGYSSLSRLNSLPLDCVKIDKSFLNALDDGDRSLCNIIINMAHSLHMQVIAEGVETPRQLELLTDMGCDFVQGYYLARPLDIPQLNAYMDTFAEPA